MPVVTLENTGATLQYEPLGEAKGAVVICPGGGYSFVSEREGAPVARAYAQAGWQPFILTYSVGNGLGTTPLRQVSCAVRTARTLLPEARPLAVCGFSAGGHLAASLGVHWQDSGLFPDAEQRRNHRPDMLLLSYPVITAGERRHADSFARLARSEVEMEYFSLEKHVDSATPPTFLWHTAEDELVPVENSLLFADALKSARVPFELHIYPFGPHGLCLATPEVEDAATGRFADPHVAGWFSQCLAWMDTIRERLQ